MAGKVLEKLKSELEEKGLKLSISERGKEGKSKVPCTSENCPRIVVCAGRIIYYFDLCRSLGKKLLNCTWVSGRDSAMEGQLATFLQTADRMWATRLPYLRVFCCDATDCVHAMWFLR